MKKNLHLPRTREELALSLKSAGLKDIVVERLVAQSRDALALEATPMKDDEIAIGASKIGGLPDLQPGVSWPVRPPYADAERAEQERADAARLIEDAAKPNSWMTPAQARLLSDDTLRRAAAIESEFPLAFIAQIDFAALSVEPGFDPILPNYGRLLFFYDCYADPGEFSPDARKNFRLIWDAGDSGAPMRTPAPDALKSISNEYWTCLFGAAALSAHSVVTPIPMNDKNWDAFDLEDENLVEIYDEWFSQFGRPDDDNRVNHQLGGWPQPLQNGMQARSHLASNGVYCGTLDDWEKPEAKALLPGAKDWRLALQIGREDAIGLNRGVGSIFVVMKTQDIHARAFECAWTVYQCD